MGETLWPKLALLVWSLLLSACYPVVGSGRSSDSGVDLLIDGNATGEYHRAFPVVKPDSIHTKLAVSREGLDVIAQITTPVAVVAVIGPYRSGKSFLLNQLLSLSCDEGFGVGHMRDTKTRGIWVWGEPLVMNFNGEKTSVLFLDTEGFESIGKSTVYDDRIFALAAIMSSVLIYNLPETVREADIGKLSFAVQLAEEFYGRVKGRESTFQPAKLLWLIQRDFLEGKTVQEMVSQALQPVPNANGNKDIRQVNRIRESLAIMAENSTAFSLKQPHLWRTRLCELNDTDFAPEYVQQREELKHIVASMVDTKTVQGKPIKGKEFASLLEQTLEALNAGDIPSASSVVEAFNRAVVDRCLSLYDNLMSRVTLPMEEDLLVEVHKEALKAAVSLFEEERFGRKNGKTIKDGLIIAIEKAYGAMELKNQYTSSVKCELLYSKCEDTINELQELRLPSMSKFGARLSQCNQSYQDTCQGPAKAVYEQRLDKLVGRARSQFIDSYNHRLFNWLVALSLIMVVVGRFCVKFLLLEVAAWAMFVFLETYTRIFWSAESLYYNPTWQVVVAVWETIIYSPILDVDRWAVPLAWLSISGFLLCRYYGFRKKPYPPLLPSVEGHRMSRFRRLL